MENWKKKKKTFQFHFDFNMVSNSASQKCTGNFIVLNTAYHGSGVCIDDWFEKIIDMSFAMIKWLPTLKRRPMKRHNE